METYKSRLQEQAKALQSDIDLMVAEVQNFETRLEEFKHRKALAFRELRSIDKKLAKLS